MLAVVGAAQPLASATPGLRHSLGFSEGYRQQLPPGAALWEVGVLPDPALLSSSSPYRAPSPAWPSSRSSRKQLLRTAAAPQRLRGEPGAPRGIIPDPAGCSGLCTDSGPAAHGTSLAAVHPPPDNVVFLGFPAFLPYFSTIASRLGPPGFSLEPWSGLWPCLPTPAASTGVCPRVSQRGAVTPLHFQLWSSVCQPGAPCAALEFQVPAPLRSRSPVQAAVPGAPLGSRACSSGVL